MTTSKKKILADDDRAPDADDDVEAPREITYADVDDVTGDVPLPEADVEIRPGVWMRVRAITREELAAVGEDPKARPLSVEQQIVVTGLIRPTLNIGQVRRWGKTRPAGEIKIAADKILELSRLGDEAYEEDVRRFPD